MGRRLLLLAGAPVLIGALCIGGYFSYRGMQNQHQDNLRALERFGFGMTPQSPYTESVGELGALQLPATFAESELTPMQKVIYGLMQDKERLLQENRELQTRLTSLETEVAELREYRTINERFAPRVFDEEVQQVEVDLKSFLSRLPEAERFSDQQIEIMAASSAGEYRRFVTQHRLELTSIERNRLINEQLPGYAFCAGDAVGIAANSSREEHLLVQPLRSGDTTSLPAPLRRDLQMVLEPCQLALRKALDTAF